jgi:hypothetical protein
MRDFVLGQTGLLPTACPLSDGELPPFCIQAQHLALERLGMSSARPISTTGVSHV